MDQGERLPKWFTIGVLVIFTGFIAGIYDFIFLRHLLEHNVLLGAILVFVFNLFAFLTYRSYYMTVVTSPIFNAADFNNQYHGEIDQIKAYAKKSNAILHTRRLRKNRYLFDTSQVKQQQLAYCDDITDLFDNQQKINQQINEDSQQTNNLQGGGEGEKQKISYVNEPNDDFEGRRQQIQQNAQADITVGGVSNQQDAEVFSQEDYQKFDQIHDLTQVKYCFKCQSVKLPRVHHCKVCNRCVSRMDHHCPWVGNCVGKENQKFFCLLLFYGGLCGMIVAISVFTDYMFYDQVIVKQMSDTEHQYTTVAGSASFPSFLVAYGMFLYQVYISLNNLTTLETNVEGIYERNPFSKSSKIENLKEVFGERMLYWLLPFHETEEKQKDEGFIQLVRD